MHDAVGGGHVTLGDVGIADKVDVTTCLADLEDLLGQGAYLLSVQPVGSEDTRTAYSVCKLMYRAFHVLVQTNFRRYYFYFLPDQAQILFDNFNVLDKL